jgi:hypothetical protein
MKQLAEGTTDGRHALGYESGKAELDANRAIAHAFPGQVPLATSRPMTSTSGHVL